MGNALKYFMQENFDFSTLKKVGFFPKEMKFNDYEGQAERICKFFGFKSIYEYGKHEINCHLSEDNPGSFINKEGNLVTGTFITTIFPNSLHI